MYGAPNTSYMCPYMHFASMLSNERKFSTKQIINMIGMSKNRASDEMWFGVHKLKYIFTLNQVKGMF